eukprot:scaffold2008_cov283-Pinguiococcus_pyrenoidosus.AAC.14
MHMAMLPVRGCQLRREARPPTDVVDERGYVEGRYRAAVLPALRGDIPDLDSAVSAGRGGQELPSIGVPVHADDVSGMRVRPLEGTALVPHIPDLQLPGVGSHREVRRVQRRPLHHADLSALRRKDL